MLIRFFKFIYVYSKAHVIMRNLHIYNEFQKHEARMEGDCRLNIKLGNMFYSGDNSASAIASESREELR